MILIDRSNVLRDTFGQLLTIPNFDMRQEIKITFMDEPAQDAGGLMREWLNALIENMLFKESKMFIMKSNGYYVIPPLGACTNEDNYFFCGKVIAKALYERMPIQQFLSKIIYLQILNKEISLQHMAYYDPDIYKSLNFLRTNHIDETMGFTFTLSILNQETSEVENIDLLPNGSSTYITEANKELFISKVYEC
jgi:E3 ubiquitin-protein ligase NEDD4